MRCLHPDGGVLECSSQFLLRSYALTIGDYKSLSLLFFLSFFFGVLYLVFMSFVGRGYSSP